MSVFRLLNVVHQLVELAKGDVLLTAEFQKWLGLEALPLRAFAVGWVRRELELLRERVVVGLTFIGAAALV